MKTEQRTKRADLIIGNRQSGKTTKIILGIVAKASNLSVRETLGEVKDKILVFSKNSLQCRDIETKIEDVISHTDMINFYPRNDALTVVREVVNMLEEGVYFPTYVYVDDLYALDVKELSANISNLPGRINWVLALE